MAGMTRGFLALSLILLACHPARAKEDDAPATLLFSCGASSRIDLKLAGDADASSERKTKLKAEAIDVGSLVIYSKDDGRGNVRRTQTRTISRSCGKLKLQVTGGYFNENRQGEWGAADDYPIIEIFDDKRSLTGRLALGSCDASNGRSSYMVECPGKWATDISVFESSGKFAIHLDHAYEEYRTP